jgi:hypothetical protein
MTLFNFKDFGINTNQKGYKGDKIKTDRLLNREITVHEYKIQDSIKEAGKKCLHLQISIGETFHVVFTSGMLLMRDIQNEGIKFPFVTTIIKEDDYLKFT